MNMMTSISFRYSKCRIGFIPSGGYSDLLIVTKRCQERAFRSKVYACRRSQRGQEQSLGA